MERRDLPFLLDDLFPHHLADHRQAHKGGQGIMNIIFEKTSAPESYGGNVRTLAPQRALKMQRELNSFDPLGPALKRSEPLQAFYDCLAVIAGFLLVSVTGVGLAFALFVLMFVRL